VLVKPELSVTVRLNVSVISGDVVVVPVIVVTVDSCGAINVGLRVLALNKLTGIPDICTHR
jgi:hypothetical protein